MVLTKSYLLLEAWLTYAFCHQARIVFLWDPEECSVTEALVSMILRCIIVKTVELVDLIEMHRPYRDAHDRQLWRDKTCPART
jgi:hypothetical protein